MDKPYILQVAVVEDDPGDAARLGDCIQKCGIPGEYRAYDDAGQFLQAFRAGCCDLVFLDIYMDGVNRGIETAEKIREKDTHVVIAFVTMSPDHTRDGYRLGALKYLDKPVTLAGVKETMEFALLKRSSAPFITLAEAGGKRVNVHYENVLYFEQQDHVIHVHMPDHVLTTSQSVRMNDIEAQLPSPPFVRCHQSFLVNLDYARAVDRDMPAFRMKDGSMVDIRRRDKGKCARYERMLSEWRMTKAGRDEE